jgi:hypothetical protein
MHNLHNGLIFHWVQHHQGYHMVEPFFWPSETTTRELKK